MRITRENYELFYLDFLDKNLDETMHAEFILFLQNNPELQLEDTSLPYLSTESIEMDKSSKQLLKFGTGSTLDVNEETIEKLLIERMEGLLSKEMESNVLSYLENHPEAMRLATLYALTKLNPEPVRYAKKSQLKKATVISMFVRWSAAAASILVFLLVGWYSKQSSLSSTLEEKRMISSVSQKPAKARNTPNPLVALTNKQLVKKAQPFSLKVLQLHKDSLENTSEATLLPIEITPVSKQEQTTLVVESAEGSNLANQPLAIEQQKEQKLLKITSYNPIPLLTAKMEDVLNRPVSFRRFRENGMQTKRFYVRVGNIEILSSKG